MLAEAQAWPFRLRANFWSCLTMRGRIDWTTFGERLKNARFVKYASNWEARSLGWAYVDGEGKWLFAVAGHRIPFYGKSAMRHELFHALQDYKTGLFHRPLTIKLFLLAELSAYFWGSPLIGLLPYGAIAWVIYRALSVVGVIADTVRIWRGG